MDSPTSPEHDEQQHQQQLSQTSEQPIEDLEWEEWDSSTSPLAFSSHCLAGSFAGVAEHTLLYPLDTVKTCWQSQVLNGTGQACGVGCEVRGARDAVNLSMMQQVGSAEPSLASVATSSATAGQQQQHHQQGIWSTMKNLMKHGSHHHHPLHGQFSPAHVYTLAGHPGAPNVVDLTGSIEASTAWAGAAPLEPSLRESNRERLRSDKAGKRGRPWSKQSRTVRKATVDDITARGTIRSASTTIDSAVMGAARGVVGFKRLWRGVQTMFVGCVPAHALYFSSYEIIKSMCLADNAALRYNDDSQQQSAHHQQQHVGHDTLSPLQAMTAGCCAALLHDMVMTPMDTVKQRMQLGHYDGLRHAFVSIVRGDPSRNVPGEGWRGLYRSFNVTVMTNVPYGMIMMTTNEWLRGALEDGLYSGGGSTRELNEGRGGEEERPFHFPTILLAGMGAGAVASAVTAPLDRVKTRLQTQRMGMAVPSAEGGAGAIAEERAVAAARGEPKVCPKMAVRDAKRALFPSAAGKGFSSASLSSFTSTAAAPPPAVAIPGSPFGTHYATPLDALRSILREEGPRGLFRGALPRVALHAPSVAISWTAYEAAKGWLVWLQ